MEPPLCTNGSAGYLMQLSVNRTAVYLGLSMSFDKVSSRKYVDVTAIFQSYRL